MNIFKKSFNKTIVRLMLIVLLALIIAPIQPIQEVYAAEPFDSLAVQAVRNSYGLHQGGSGSFNGYDAYILTQSGADLSAWEYSGTSLKDNVLTDIDEIIANPNEMALDWSGNPAFVHSAKKIAYEYLAAKIWTDAARASQLLAVLQGRQTASGDGTFDGNAFSDLPAFEALGRVGDIASIDTAAAITAILASQDGTTGAWTPSWNDVQATAQAVRALKYLEPLAGGQTAAVQAAINEGLDWLEARQLANGSFRDAFNFDDPLVDTAEIIFTLDLVGTDPTTWNVGGKSAVDYMRDDALTGDGTFGMGNQIDNTWALDAYRMLGGSVAVDTILAVQVTPATASIAVGNTQQYTAHNFKMDGTSADISATATWTVNDTSIATVNVSGLVTGVAAGNAVVKASSQGVDGTANVVVAGGGGGIIIPQGTPVQVKVTGRSGETLYSQSTVYLRADDRNSRNDLVGITPVGALNKTGLSYNYDSLDYIHTIAGQSPVGMNGWMYRVNGAAPGVSAINYTLSANDVIWWFYSTDPSNITSMETVVKLLNDLATGDETILEVLEKGGDVNIDLENRKDQIVEILADNIKKLEDKQKEMTLTNGGIAITFPPQAFNIEQVEKSLGNADKSLQIGAKEISSEEKQDILSKAGLGQSSGIFDIGGKIFDLTAQIVSKAGDEITGTEKITGFNEPVKVTIELPGDLTDEDIAKLTAVRYEKDSTGNIVPVKLGGSYDPATKTFTFYTDKFSYYGVVKADKLITISMGINMLTTIRNGQKGYTDMAPILHNNRTMVPLRFIAENLGAEVQWFEKTRTAEIKLGGKTLRLVADEIIPGMDTAPVIKGGRILVPLRFVTESFGARVTWFPATQRIEIVL